MPKVWPCGPELYLIYDANDIRSFAQAASDPQAKCALSKQATFGLDAAYSQKLELDFSLSYFKFQGKTFDAWKELFQQIINPTPRGLLEVAIIQAILQLDIVTHKIDGNAIKLAQQYLLILKQAYQGDKFELPFHIIQKIISPHKWTHIQNTKDVTLSGGIPAKVPDKSIELYYDSDSKPKQWVVIISNKIAIYEHALDVSTPFEYSIKATLPFDPQAVSNSLNGFTLTEITIRTNAHYAQALDCFLHTNQDWQDVPMGLPELLAPLTNFCMTATDSYTSAVNPQATAANELKLLLSDSDPGKLSIATISRLVTSFQQPDKLHGIVWNLGFLIAIKYPSLFRALGIARPCMQPYQQ